MKTLAAFVFGLAVLSTVELSWGTLYSVSENYGGVVALNQNDVQEVGGGTGANSCVPTATMTSFQYLNVFYADVYGTNPVTGNPTLMGPSATWTDAATNLSQNYMFTDAVAGTSANNWIDGKVNYLNTLAPEKNSL